MAVLRPLITSWTGKAIVGVAAIAVIGGVVIAPRFAASAPPTQLRTVNVARGNVVQTVTVSGSLNASAVWKIPFKVTGRLVDIPVKVGTQVKTGQVLAQLDTTDLRNALRQAQVNLATAQARYDALVAGASADDVALAKASVDNAQRSFLNAQLNGQTSVSNAQQNLDSVKASYAAAQSGFQLLTDGVKADVGSVTTALDSLRLQIAATLTDFKGAETADVTSAKTSLGNTDGLLANAKSYAGNSAGPALAEWLSARDNLVAAWVQFDAAVSRGTETSGAASQFSSAKVAYDLATSRLSATIAPVTSALSSAQGPITSAQNALATYTSQNNHDLDTVRADLVALQTSLVTQASVASGITTKITQSNSHESTINTAIGGTYVNALQSLRSAKDQATQSVADRQAAVESAQLSFQKTTASPTQADIASSYASVQLAQISLEKAQTDLDNATLRAPVDGVVATIANGVGEAPANPFMTIAVVSSVILHGTVGESDIAKLKMSQVATVSVDAAGLGQRLTGKVTGIDPVATISQGVPVYGIDVQIDLPDAAVRPGMSGTASIIVASAQGVLTVPNLAIRTTNGQRVVQVMRNGQAEEAQLTFGISNDTVTEIKSGLAEGDTVVIPAARTATATQRPGGFGGGQPVIIGR